MNGGQRSFNSELVNKLFFHICTLPLHIQLIQSLIYLLVPKGSSSDQLFITGRLIRIDSHGKEFQRCLLRIRWVCSVSCPPTIVLFTALHTHSWRIKVDMQMSATTTWPRLDPQRWFRIRQRNRERQLARPLRNLLLGATLELNYSSFIMWILHQGPSFQSPPALLYCRVHDKWRSIDN